MQGVGAIVHATNPYLDIRGNASTALAAAAGQVFQQSCSQILKANSWCLLQGEAHISTFAPGCSGQLNCQHVIHAVLPKCCGKPCITASKLCFANIFFSSASSSQLLGHICCTLVHTDSGIHSAPHAFVCCRCHAKLYQCCRLT